ncbi:hypothetical protein I4U23_001830 [Adineta vaga]|nr:hypothetical protein I4U23_001830 [Adineta vaga]
MKKGTKGEVVLSPCQIQAIRLNGLENRRLQIHIKSLRGDLQTHLSRLHREQQGLKYHFKNVVRVIKPNPAYQLWRQAHAHEIAQDEAKNFIESIKMKEKLISISRGRSTSPPDEVPCESNRPLLLLLDNEHEKSTDPFADKTKHLLRPRTTPVQKRSTIQHRNNPLITLLDGYTNNSNPVYQQQQQQQSYSFESPSYNSSSSMGTPSTQRFQYNKLLDQQKASNIDVLYRIALQNQTACKSIDKKAIEERKLHDREFALRHRALQSSIRMARLTNKSN